MNHPMSLEPCVICRNQDYQCISRQDRKGEPLETVACTECGLVRHAKMPSESELQNFYASEYREAYHGESAPSPRRVMRAWANGRRIARQVEPFLPRGRSRVMEVGAGLGCNLKALEGAGRRCEGVEPHAGFQEYAARRVRADVRNAYLKDLPRTPTYNLVLLIHVIEHLRQPDLDVRHIRDLLRSDGLFYVECPNLAAPFARRSRMFHFAHVFNFTPHTLQSLVEQCGFRLLQRFGAANDPNLQMLFVRDKPRTYETADGYRSMLAAIDGQEGPRYFLRPSYLARSARKFANMAWEGVVAPQRVRTLQRKWAA